MPNFINAFEEDVYQGLTAYPKKLSSKYFYDEKGDKIFQQIMNMPEYYLTNAEYNIIETHKKSLAEKFAGPTGFDLIELGAGDGKKTKVLLKYLNDEQYKFTYLPIDISKYVLKDLKESLAVELPNVDVQPQEGMYFEVLSKLAEYKHRKKVIMVLGSNIGNLLHEKAIEFLQNIQQSMNEGDLLFMGFDQKKHPQQIINAYSDKAGITEAFNKNLLTRINRELEANFDLDQFLHWETYDPETGTAKSFLVAKENLKVTLKKLHLTVNFDAWETIHTEISQKYDDHTVNWLAERSNLKVIDQFTDDNNLFKNYVFSI
ncbi:L-histidine N(alpha)-methyltransferase [Galbibacter mesophilus]|uniref:L-histidine N(alpha)-methyltransferase n=1 Tax=Galbibacter mesophilus TaxID=379069 RepID=UPI00191F2204|nr:L-histidine N(alpha)-methyltransferase [Galbibacter mesophilus]MCM5661523.1 L-histidine N(alpha)-methyltransferase [Galbibacter mesophilus]